MKQIFLAVAFIALCSVVWATPQKTFQVYEKVSSQNWDFFVISVEHTGSQSWKTLAELGKDNYLELNDQSLCFWRLKFKADYRHLAKSADFISSWVDVIYTKKENPREMAGNILAVILSDSALAPMVMRTPLQMSPSVKDGSTLSSPTISLDMLFAAPKNIEEITSLSVAFLDCPKIQLIPTKETASLAVSVGQRQTSLSEKENPEAIGKRNINKDQINFYSLEKEVAIGRQFATEVDRSAKLVEDPIIVEYINKVGQWLVLHSDAKVPFTIKVIDSDEFNAFALPGGFFYINKGIILAAGNEAELAGPMAHMIAHVAARHITEQMSKEQVVKEGMAISTNVVGGWAGFAMRQASSLTIPLSFLKHARIAEEEADLLGVQYLWATGYDPHAMAVFFEKVLVKEKRKPGTIDKMFSTHPSAGDRINKINDLIARLPSRSEYTVNTSEFQQVKSRLISVTNARAANNNRSDASDKQDNRPTLRRKEQPAAPISTTTGQAPVGEREQKPTSDRPVSQPRSNAGEQPTVAVASKSTVKPLTNQDIIDLAKDGLNETNLIETIKEASAVQFNLAPEAQRNLLRNGVSNVVIAAMRSRQVAKQKSSPQTRTRKKP